MRFRIYFSNRVKENMRRKIKLENELRIERKTRLCTVSQIYSTQRREKVNGSKYSSNAIIDAVAEVKVESSFTCYYCGFDEEVF